MQPERNQLPTANLKSSTAETITQAALLNYRRTLIRSQDEGDVVFKREPEAGELP